MKVVIRTEIFKKEDDEEEFAVSYPMLTVHDVKEFDDELASVLEKHAEAVKDDKGWLKMGWWGTDSDMVI